MLRISSTTASISVVEAKRVSMQLLHTSVQRRMFTQTHQCVLHTIEELILRDSFEGK